VYVRVSVRTCPVKAETTDISRGNPVDIVFTDDIGLGADSVFHIVEVVATFVLLATPFRRLFPLKDLEELDEPEPIKHLEQMKHPTATNTSTKGSE
jgi:hypothetical protein